MLVRILACGPVIPSWVKLEVVPDIETFVFVRNESEFALGKPIRH